MKTTTTTGEKKWLKLGAAAFLSVTMLAACGDNDDDVDVINPPGDVDDGGDTDVDVDVDDKNDEKDNSN